MAANEHAPVWGAFTGLTGPDSEQAWAERIRRACEAPLWEREAAETLAAEFVTADGGDPGKPHGLFPDSVDLLTDAVWALWMLATSPQGCPGDFPSLASSVLVWYNLTGMRGPTDLAAWRERLDRICATSADDEGAQRLAEELVREDRSEVMDPNVLNVLNAMRVVARHPEACT